LSPQATELGILPKTNYQLLWYFSFN